MSRTPAYLGPADFFSRTDLGMSYTDYLQQREFHDTLSVRITEQTKQLITAGQEALGAQIRQLEKVEAAQADAAYEVVCSVRDLRQATEDGFRQVGSMLEWGFSGVILQLSRGNDLLSEIRNLIADPSLTWACARFNRARDLQRRGHYAEALASVDMALEGHGTELGEATEPRFHYLRGVLRLGSFDNNSADVVDLREAQRSFLLASKYAAHDFPAEAAKAQLCAARAANLQGNFGDAAVHAKKGLQFNDMVGLHYELARALLQLGRPEEATDHLQSAIRGDRNLLLKAIGDPAFLVRPGFVDAAIEDLVTEIMDFARFAEAAIDEELSRLVRVSYASPTTGETYEVDECNDDTIGSARAMRQKLKGVQAIGGLVDLWKALEELPGLWNRLGEWDRGFKERLKCAVRAHFVQARARLEAPPPHSEGPSDALPVYWGMGTGAAAFLLGCAKVLTLANNPSAGTVDDMLGALLGLVAGPFIWGGIAYAIAAFVVSSSRSSAQSDHDERQRRRAGLASAESDEQERITRLRLYEPSTAALDSIPFWVTGNRAVK